MPSERWNLVRSIVEEALELPAGERDAFVAESSAGDRELAREVRELLAMESDRASERFSPAALERAARGVLDFDRSGARIGSFQLEARIASGGMGEVWRAQRIDGFTQVQGLEQTVAIKLIKLGMDTEEMLRRFANERALLAGLQHDGIARLFDGGADERGRPYLVMEFVDGMPIDRYCNEHALSIRERIGLVLSVCEAVAFAHERLVVHRDIKPSNILVARDGRPKLCDFGIAKVVAPDGHERAAERTLTGQRVLTPAYASPEQLAGEPITTQSDVYSLGVVLWELCVGQRAFGEDRTESTAIPRASTALLLRTGSRRVARELAGDLDTILAAACHLDPARRYRSVSALADDLRAFLARQPVRARRDSVAYRTSKFVERNRLLVASLAIIFLALASATVVSSRMYVRASNARDDEAEQRTIAAERFDETRELATKFLFDVHDSIKDLPGSTAVREMLLSRAVETLDKLAVRSATSPDLDADLFTAYMRLSDALCQPGQSNLGRLDDAIRALDRAEAIALRVDATDPTRSKWLAQVEYGRGNVGFTKQAYPEAEVSYAACFALLSGLSARDLDPISSRRRGDAAARLAQVARVTVQLDEAECWLAELSASRATQPGVTLEESLNDRAVIEQERSQVAERRGDLEAALERRQTALGCMDRLAAIAPASTGFRTRAASIATTIAGLLTKLGRPERAVEMARRASDTLRECVLLDPDDVYTLTLFLSSLYELGSAQYQHAQWSAARDTCDEMAGAAAVKCARQPSVADGFMSLATARTMQGLAVLNLDDWPLALGLFDEALVDTENASRRAPIGQRASPPSFYVQIAGSLAIALQRHGATLDASTARRALELAEQSLARAEHELAEFEPTARESPHYEKVLGEAKRARSKLAEIEARGL